MRTVAFTSDCHETETEMNSLFGPGPVMAYVCALSPVVGKLATANTSDRPSIVPCINLRAD